MPPRGNNRGEVLWGILQLLPISEVLYFGTRRAFTTKDFEEEVQTLNTAITDISACSLYYWLLKFVQEVRHYFIMHTLLCFKNNKCLLGLWRFVLSS